MDGYAEFKYLKDLIKNGHVVCTCGHASHCHSAGKVRRCNMAHGENPCTCKNFVKK